MSIEGLKRDRFWELLCSKLKSHMATLIDLFIVYVVHDFVKCTMLFESIPLFLGAAPLGAGNGLHHETLRRGWDGHSGFSDHNH